MAGHLSDIRVTVQVGGQIEGWIIDAVVREELMAAADDSAVVETVQAWLRRIFVRELHAKRLASVATEVEAFIEQHSTEIT